MLLSLALAAGLLAADTVRPPAAAASSAAPAAVIVHHQPALPIVALRMSLLVYDPPGFAGAGHLFQRLALPRLREQVRQVGGQLQIQRNSDALVYTVIGPAAELDYLAAVLRSALGSPSATEPELIVAQRQLREARLAEWEIAPRHVRAAIRAELFPEDLPAPGTAASAERLTLQRLRGLWAAMYDPDRVSVVAVGDVELERVRQAFAELPPRPRDPLRESFQDTVPVPRLAPAEATHAWLGLGYSASEANPVALTVTARLLADALRERIADAPVDVDHWWTHHGQALVAVVAVPGPNLAAARRALGAALPALEEAVTEEQVRAAVTALRREMLYYGRTPERMAEVVGQFADRSGDPNAAQRFFAELDQVRAEDVRQIVRLLSARTPIRIDIPPQALRRS